MSGGHRERFELARQQYGRALARLHEVLAVDESEIVRDALIQRFEFTYELAWKTMFYWLRDAGEKVPEIVRAVLQAGFKAELISDAQAWERIKEFRDETSHTYDQNKAIEVAAFVRAEAIVAFDALQARLALL
ncbi:HI0074 family nucleotidyltransferase substrate-binding subunit [Metallibacterium sp.]|uniref:HI0074 family nucleotidyltransferase substrate-binding subunit n=1 Tax=Metallibacterium sp. TaxID=2940281 RepID=UPI0026325128|nr:HI0074 family nucleotidyltransferase substrate-binding subunit [Metallibacterium sp.]